MAVVKLFPFRRGDQILFRGKLVSGEVSVFKPFRRGDHKLLRGKNAAGEVLIGFPFRRGNHLFARTISETDPTGCCYVWDGEEFDYLPDKTEAECESLDGQWFPESPCIEVPPPDTTVCGCVENAEEGVWRFAQKATMELSGFEGWARGYTYTFACGRESVPWDCSWSNLAGGGVVLASDAWRIEENWNEINGTHVLDDWYAVGLPGQDACYWEKSWEIDVDECNCPLFCEEPYGDIQVSLYAYVAADYWRKPDGEVWEYIYVAAVLTISVGGYGGLGTTGIPMTMGNDYIPEDEVDDETGYWTSTGSRIVIGTRKYLNSDLTPADPEDRYTECQKPPYGPATLRWLVGPPPANYCDFVDTNGSDNSWSYEGAVTPPTALIRLFWIDT